MSALFIISIIFIYLLLRIPGLTLIPVFCDEAIYIHWAQLISKDFFENAFIPLVDGKTPLFMWLMIPFLGLFDDPLFAGRMLSVVSGLVTVSGVLFLGFHFFNKRVGLISALFVSVTPYIVFFDRLALVDSLLSAFSIWSLILALSIVKRITIHKVFLLGCLLGGGVLTKTPGLFSFILLPLALLTAEFKKIANRKLMITIAGLVSAVVIGYLSYNILRLATYFERLSSRNQDYYFPFSRLLETPLNPLTGHLVDVFDWSIKMVTWPIMILSITSVVLIFYKRNRTALTIFLWGILPAIPLMLLLKTFTARYLLFCLPPLIFLAGWSFNSLYQIITFRHKLWLSSLTLILILIPSLSFNYYLLFDPAKANLPSGERHGYLEDWTAGYGLKEITGLLNDYATDQKIVVVTEGAFGTLPDGLLIYLKDNPNIEVWYGSSILEEYVYEESQLRPTYFVVNKSHEAFNRNLKLIKEYPKTKNLDFPQDSTLLYQVLP